MVLWQNVSDDVYGTFCMESEGQTQTADPNMSCNSDLAGEPRSTENKHFQESQAFPLRKLVLKLLG